MLRNVLLKTLRDLRWPTFWTGLGLGVLGFYFMWIIKTFENTFDWTGLMEEFPPAMKALVGGQLIDFSSPTGFLNMELFPLILPLVLSGFATALASGATAGEEARGTLDVLLAEPVDRARVLVEKTIAIIAGTVAVGVALFAGIWLGALAVGSRPDLGLVAAGVLSAILLALAFGGIALAIACATGNRATAIGVTGALLVVTYFVNALAPLVDMLDRIRWASPFYYYIGNDPLRNGLDIGHAAVLGCVAVAVFVAALLLFERRDLTA